MSRRILISIALSFILLFFSTQCVNAAENYCNEEESWKKWDELVQKYPNDHDIQTLHALRIGFCLKIERGDLTIEQATEIFERARGIIVNKKRADAAKEEGGI